MAWGGWGGRDHRTGAAKEEGMWAQINARSRKKKKKKKQKDQNNAVTTIREGEWGKNPPCHLTQEGRERLGKGPQDLQHSGSDACFNLWKGRETHMTKSTKIGRKK